MMLLQCRQLVNCNFPVWFKCLCQKSWKSWFSVTIGLKMFNCLLAFIFWQLQLQLQQEFV